MKSRLFAAALAALLAAAASAQETAPPPVAEVRFASFPEQAVDEGFLRAHVSVAANQAYSPAATGRDVSSLLKTGRFSDVRVLAEESPRGIALLYRVTPKPRLGQAVSVESVTVFRVGRLLDELDLEPGDWVDEMDLGPKAKAVEELYRREGYADVYVRSELAITDTNAWLCSVRLIVEEGLPARLQKVVVEGNGNVPERRIRALLNLPWGYNIWYWFRKPNYDAEDMERRLDDVRNYYRDLGYLGVEVLPRQIETNANGRLKLTFRVEEGPLYTVRRVTVRGVKEFVPSAVEKRVALREGDTAAMAAIRDSAKAIKDYYGERGYIRTDVEWIPAIVGENMVDVAFEVREGKLTRIGDILIRGNVTTKEKVIRREVNVYPGEVFNEVKVAQTERRLRNLNYFETVTSTPAPTRAPGTNDLVIDVMEKSTGLFSVGAQFSSVDQLVGTIQVTQNNFDLLGWPTFTGGGQRAKLSLEAGSTMNNYTLSLLEPWFLDRPLRLSGELYTMSRRYDEYDIERTGGSPALEFPVFPAPLTSRLELRYRLEHVKISDVEDTDLYTDVDGTTFAYTEEDAHTDSTISAMLSRDRRDSGMAPTRGYRVSTGASLTGGPMGFDTDIYGLSLKAEQHIPLKFRHVLSFRASAETQDRYGSTDEVPLSERFYMGGPYTVRGFENRQAGPKAYREIPNPDGTTYTEYKPRGGQTLLLAGAEYNIPLGHPYFRFCLFFDIGSLAVDAYDFSAEEYAWGTGVGIRFDIPFFPVRIDYAVDTGLETNGRPDETDRERWSIAGSYGF